MPAVVFSVPVLPPARRNAINSTAAGDMMDTRSPDNDNEQARGGTVRIFVFKSETRPDLRAFGGDLTGTRLPKQFSPWHAVGAIAPDQDPPCNLSRETIEAAINTQGFQLWRVTRKDSRNKA